MVSSCVGLLSFVLWLNLHFAALQHLWVFLHFYIAAFVHLYVCYFLLFGPSDTTTFFYAVRVYLSAVILKLLVYNMTRIAVNTFFVNILCICRFFLYSLFYYVHLFSVFIWMMQLPWEIVCVSVSFSFLVQNDLLHGFVFSFSSDVHKPF